MGKALEILFGPFRYRRTPAAAIDGGMAEYTFEQFQELPPQNVVGGRGWIYRQDLMLAEPDLFVFAPVGPPIDVAKVPLGIPLIEQPMIEEDFQE
jgi:hypothetical protein